MMGQFDDKVERQRKLIAAEEWSRGIKALHAHSMIRCGMIIDLKIQQMVSPL